jgi:hypothetical protein
VAAVYGGTQLLSGDVGEASAGEASFLAGGSAPLRGPSGPQVSRLTPFLDPLRIPPTLKPSACATTEVRLVAAKVRLYSQLPPTPTWQFVERDRRRVERDQYLAVPHGRPWRRFVRQDLGTTLGVHPQRHHASRGARPSSDGQLPAR